MEEKNMTVVEYLQKYGELGIEIKTEEGYIKKFISNPKANMMRGRFSKKSNLGML